MSTAHIVIRLLPAVPTSPVEHSVLLYRVLSPEFSKDSVTPKQIGTLQIDRSTHSFAFSRLSDVEDIICPPELFQANGATWDSVLAVCEAQHFVALKWSFLIHQAALVVLTSTSPPLEVIQAM